MFKKRNFSLIQSPSSSNQPAAPKFGSPAKRTRLLSSNLKTPTLFLQETTTKESTAAEKSPLFQRLSESLNLGTNHQLSSTLLSNKDQSLDEAVENAKTHMTNDVVSHSEATTIVGGTLQGHQDTSDDCNILIFERDGMLETPPATPSSKIGTKIENLIRQKDGLKLESKRLDGLVEEKFSQLKNIRAKTIELQSKDLILDDHLDILARGHRQVRNLLNEIYNPGNELGTRASHFIEEIRRRHHKKFEKVAFEMNQRIETSQEAMRKKFEELQHEIELHERTLMTIECQKRHEQSQKVEINLMDEEVEVMVEVETEAEPEPEAQTQAQAQADQESNSNNDVPICEKFQNNDDDCIIIEDNDAAQSEVGNEVELTAHTPELQDVDINISGGNNSGGNNSLTTITYDDEETDIDEPKEEDEPRSFTPCQAQRPN